jgi:hypothetical protein
MSDTPRIEVKRIGHNYATRISWCGCIIIPDTAADGSYTTHTDAVRGARRALRRLGYIDLFTEPARKPKNPKL